MESFKENFEHDLENVTDSNTEQAKSPEVFYSTFKFDNEDVKIGFEEWFEEIGRSVFIHHYNKVHFKS